MIGGLALVGGPDTRTAVGVPPRPPSVARTVAGFTPDGLPVARGAVQRLLTSIFASSGRRRHDPTRGLGDPGLLGPGSASWRLLAEPAGLAAGVRSLLLQALHPLAMAGVVEHSDFRADPLGRLERTSAYVTTTTYGATDAAVRVARVVRALHPRVRGVAPNGLPYAADEPRLLTWVSIGFTASVIECDRLWSPRPADRAEVDRFVDEQARVSALLDPRADLDALAADPAFGAAMRRGTLGRTDLPLLDDLPRDLDELRDVLESFEPELEAGEQARETWAFLREPPVPAAFLPLHRVVAAGAIASLPARHRAAMGAPTDPVSTALAVQAAGAAVAGLRVAAGRSPALAASRARAAGRVWTG